MADASAQRQSAHSGGRDNSAGSGEPRHMRGMIHVAPRASASGSDGVGCGINTRVFHGREVDDQAVITNSQASCVMTATADCQKQLIVSSKVYRADYICHICAARYHPRFLVYHSIVHFAGFIIIFIARLYQSSAEVCLEI